MNRVPTVLVVAPLADERERIGALAEEAGCEVMLCPGPEGADGCLQLRGRRCPLSAAADVVILDLELKGDVTSDSAPGWVLLDSYLSRGSRVIALADALHDDLQLQGLPVVVVRRPAGRRELLPLLEEVVAAPARSREATGHGLNLARGSS